MTRTNTAEVQAERASRPKAALPGTTEPADPDNYYVIEPGEDHPEYFRPVLRAKEDGLEAAINRAAFLSFSASPQRVTRRRPGPAPGTTSDKTFLRYQNGHGISLVA